MQWHVYLDTYVCDLGVKSYHLLGMDLLTFSISVYLSKSGQKLHDSLLKFMHFFRKYKVPFGRKSHGKILPLHDALITEFDLDIACSVMFVAT